MVRLRGHHLICLQFYRGEGYSKDFVENLYRVLEKAKSEGVEVVEGEDDVCIACPYNRNGICTHSDEANREIRRLDELAIRLLSTPLNSKVEWGSVGSVRDVLAVWKKEACKGCDWRGVCKI